ncbi:NAD(P)/FAD-dependent oxidoreductase [Actinokineospora pegani]|uniref:NAD(P)/FAD-dependent oxidoreductase n=1 Tax=Actinokineospora pegani TaxID=2654637 RepID=UPI0018D31B33|nr:FAD-dependent oxidoreductase [Actinokineospora pegani]
MAVLVIGAGISGIACARALHDAGVGVRVVERGHVVGGRLATKRYAGRPTDIGAAYLTARDPGFRAVVDDWTARGLALPWTDTLLAIEGDTRERKTGPTRFAAPGGLRRLVADLATGLDVTTGHTATAEEVTGTVVLAMPGPQAARLLPAGHPAHRAAAEQRWHPALAVTLEYADRTWSDFKSAFVNGHPVLQSVSDDGSRRGDAAPVLVAHTTPDFTGGHLENPDAAAPGVAESVGALFDLPAPMTTHVHRWTFATPAHPAGAPFLLTDGVGLVGDAWGPPRVETAWLSGTALARALIDGM